MLAAARGAEAVQRHRLARGRADGPVVSPQIALVALFVSLGLRLFPRLERVVDGEASPVVEYIMYRLKPKVG